MITIAIQYNIVKSNISVDQVYILGGWLVLPQI